MKYLLLPLLLLLSVRSGAQDPQFSQYYLAPLLLNPALTGTADCYRAGMNARTQWTGLVEPFNTASVFIDLNYPGLMSGFGLLLLHDNIGTPSLSSNEVRGYYAYHVPIHNYFDLRFGLEASYVSRGIDYSRLIFEDQFSGTTVTQATTNDEVTEGTNVRYADFSAGTVLYGGGLYWLGFAAHHLNRPEQAFFQGPSRLPIKYTLHGGLNFKLWDNKNHKRGQPYRHIIPTFLYKSEVKFDQMDLGVYFLNDPFLFGVSYRGIFAKEHEGIRNSDAVIGQVGISHRSYSICYSYDATASRLNIVNTHGSHEFTLIYEFCADWPPHPHKPPHRMRELPCPDFQRSKKYELDGNGF